jgi:hypothetical protein
VLSQPLVFLFDADSSSTTTASTSEAIEPATARLIAAQRLGLSRYHNLGDPSDEAIRQINEYGALRPQAVLHGEESRLSMFAIIEGVDEIAGAERRPIWANAVN